MPSLAATYPARVKGRHLPDEARRDALRALFERRRAFLLPGAFNALGVRLIERMGFHASYVTGAGLSNMGFGLPDLGFLGLSDVAGEVARIRAVSDLPLVVDADTGFGNAVNAWHAVKVLERAGADAIQIEDQTSPKRCGHFAGKDVVPLGEARDRIKAAVDARTRGTLIVARTDSAARLGFQAAVERACAFAQEGADVLFVEAIEAKEELLQLPSMLPKPALCNVVIGGRTPVLPNEVAAEAGYGCVLYANAALQAALLGMERALGVLRDNGHLLEDPDLLATFSQRQVLVGKGEFDALELRYQRSDS